MVLMATLRCAQVSQGEDQERDNETKGRSRHLEEIIAK